MGQMTAVEFLGEYRSGEKQTTEEAAKRIVELEADIANTLKAILFHFGPDGAKKVTDMVIEQRAKRA